jgi:hypothetical protein
VKFVPQLGATLLGLAAVFAVARSAEPKVDGDLLEFLGSVDSEDKDWHDYLARTDIEKVAQRPARAPPVPPAAPAPKDPVGATRPGTPPAQAVPGAPMDQT